MDSHQLPIWTREAEGSFSSKSAYLKLREELEAVESNQNGDCSAKDDLSLERNMEHENSK